MRRNPIPPPPQDGNKHAQKGIETRTGKINVRADIKTIDSLKWLAEKSGLSQADVIAVLISKEIERQEVIYEAASSYSCGGIII